MKRIENKLGRCEIKRKNLGAKVIITPIWKVLSLFPPHIKQVMFLLCLFLQKILVHALANEDFSLQSSIKKLIS